MEKWTDEDVQALLNIYAEENIQKEFESSARNAKVYQKISVRLEEMGILHSPQRCREKIKKMKQDYKKIKDHNRINGGSNRRTGKWFERLDAILGQRGLDSGCGDSGDCVSVLLEPLTDQHRRLQEEEEEEKVSFTEDDQYSELSFGSPAAHTRPTCRPPAQPHLPGPCAGKRKRDGEVLEVMRQLEEEQMEALRRDYEQRERHFQLLLQHIREEFSVRREEAARARRQQRDFQQGVLTLLTQLVHVLGGRNLPSSSSPPLD
ncbi:zinc finger and SCAN domain-containing protein 29-like [Hemibagrus wyckioides]|uniref:zinc finger and SCAN domain-containing protein 29-like n=1 Tax=Hemibagrus wyckioides TaxID=337641 RepID=UPI00266B51A4|nr:zinc finger and SCAN domain-containing protein 29-like [Hemibagrus wyckioides]